MRSRSRWPPNPADILKVAEHPDYAPAVPTPDHFIPLLYTCWPCRGGGSAAAFLRGYAMGSLSMTCYGLGVDGLKCVDGEGAAGVPHGVPADQTNI